uniref:Uncharacterized protein n=1 Tax=Hyaloperonospora arabidopsidis (strain Emoy2) TaxID=559515 RepID=M4B6I5_HYAAE
MFRMRRKQGINWIKFVYLRGEKLNYICIKLIMSAGPAVENEAKRTSSAERSWHYSYGGRVCSSVTSDEQTC